MGYCLLAYVVLVHLSIVLERPPLAGLALAVLGTSFLWKPLGARRPAAWLALAAVAALSAWSVQAGVTLYALYLPPIAIPFAMFYWWAGTLRAGRVPMVTRMATVIRGPLSPAYARYCRAVTQLWVLVFAVLFGLGVGLALWASPPTWSLFTNFLNNVFIGLVFLGEYLYRRVRFRGEDHPSFVTFIGQVIRSNPRRTP